MRIVQWLASFVYFHSDTMRVHCAHWSTHSTYRHTHKNTQTIWMHSDFDGSSLIRPILINHFEHILILYSFAFVFFLSLFLFTYSINTAIDLVLKSQLSRILFDFIFCFADRRDWQYRFIWLLKALKVSAIHLFFFVVVQLFFSIYLVK